MQAKPFYLSAITLSLALGATLVAGTEPASAAGASRTFVSGKGLDTNPCTITAPCRSFQQAVSVTEPAGEVVVLDPAGYGVVTITQSVSIVDDGVGTASISVPAGGTGITVNASGASVHIRGIEIDGNNAGNNSGVSVVSASSVEVENCVIRHLQNGVISTATSLSAEIQNTTIGDNSYGVFVQAQSDTVNLDVVHMPNNYYGVYTGNAANSSSVNIRRGFLSGSGGAGVYATVGIVVLSDSEITGSQVGVQVPDALATVAVDRSTITANTTGLENDSGIIYTYQNNSINFNHTNTTGTITTLAPE